MKNIALALLFVLLGTSSFAQRGTSADSIYMKLQKKYGNDVAYTDASQWGYSDDFWLGKGFYFFGKNNFMGVADINGKIVLEPLKYTNIIPVGKNQLGINGFYVTDKFNKTCILDSLGIRKTIYVDGTAEDGVYITMLDGFYDASGAYAVNKIKQGTNPIEVEYFRLYSVEGKLLLENAQDHIGAIGEGLIGVKVGDLWGYMDLHSGEMVIPAQYAAVSNFVNGRAKVQVDDNNVIVIANPLKNNGKLKILSSASVEDHKSDIDENIPTTNDVQENTFVVIIANQNYQNFAVPYALADGNSFKEYCLKTLGIPESNIIHHTDATLNVLRSSMVRVNNLAEVYEGDAKIIFYFCGQGLSDVNGKPYLMPTDASPAMLGSTCYSLETLFKELGNLDVQSAIVLIDAGFNNEMRDGKALQNHPDTKSFHDTNPVNGKVAVLMSASSGEASLGFDNQAHGFFTYFLCKKLQQSQGSTSLKALFDYLSANVPKTAQEAAQRKQTPKVTYSPSVNLNNIKL